MLWTLPQFVEDDLPWDYPSIMMPDMYLAASSDYGTPEYNNRLAQRSVVRKGVENFKREWSAFLAANPVDDPPPALAGPDKRDETARLNDEAGELLDELQFNDQCSNRLAASRVQLLERARLIAERKGELLSGDLVRKFKGGGWTPQAIAEVELHTEIGALLKITHGAARKLVTTAKMLAEDLPLLLEALNAGDTSYLHAEKIARHAADLPRGTRGEFDKTLEPGARKDTVSITNTKARKLREKLHPDSLLERHKTAFEKRNLRLEPALDGMATITVELSAASALGIHHRVSDVARSLQGPHEQRTLAQLRVDVFTDLMLCGETTTGDYKKIVQPTLFINVPALTMLGRSDEPAVLDGYGPIDIETARDLASGAPSMIRVLTDPHTGVALGVGRTRRATKEMKTFLQLRDEHCRYPGCIRPVSQCDIDHTVDYQFGGHTELENLAFLCTVHHGTKTYTGWALAQDGTGNLIWTSPSKREYVTEPSNFIGFVPTETPRDSGHSTNDDTAIDGNVVAVTGATTKVDIRSDLDADIEWENESEMDADDERDSDSNGEVDATDEFPF